jgi:hypothetical protein
MYVFDDDYALDPQRCELRYMGKLVKLKPQVFKVVSEATLISRVKAARQAIGDRWRRKRASSVPSTWPAANRPNLRNCGRR